MKQIVIWGFILALVVVLGARIVSRFVDSTPELVRVLDITMFTLLGILWMGFAWANNHKIIKLLLFIGGCYWILYYWISLPDFLRGLLLVLVFLPLVLIKIKPGRFS